MTDQDVMQGLVFHEPGSGEKANCRLLEPRVSPNGDKDKTTHDLKSLFDMLPLKNGITVSFHHHLRDGDDVMNMVMKELAGRGLSGLTLAASAIFPVHAPLVSMIKDQTVTQIVTNYVNGPVGEALSDGCLSGRLVMDTHGGRARAIETGELPIDIAFIAASASDIRGNANGIEGPSACGTLGYTIPDLKHAALRVIVTDTLLPSVAPIDIDGRYVDHVLVVPSIGDPKRIRSGTTEPTKDPVQQRIAHTTARLIDALGLVKDGMTFQTGAGGVSLAVASDLKTIMRDRHIKGRYASGGITSFLVDMLEDGLFDTLYDVQCFDTDAVRSYRENANHVMMDASFYASPCHGDRISKGLDVVVLGGSEVDLSFNVNVTTDSSNLLIGGSGGHADTAAGAKVSFITTSLLKGRIPAIKDRVTTITTPGESVDIIVTERGIAINPLRFDLLEQAKRLPFDFVSVQTLMERAHMMSGKPEKMSAKGEAIGVVRHSDGTVTDIIRKRVCL
jgi:citrate lyase subunit alpha / citrate CoA-transferase